MPAFEPRGIMTALVTPFHPDGSINWEVQADLIEYQVSAGVTGLAVTAGSGEYVNLTPDERAEVVRRAATALRGRAALVAGILAPDTGGAISASLAARAGGAQALLVSTPYYISPSLPGLVAHFRDVAEAVELPIILYNNPGRTGINLDLPVLERLVEVPGVVAIKECDRDLGRVAVKLMHLGERLTFLSGDDDLCLQIWSIGAQGAIMASSNLAAGWAVAACTAAQEGDWDRAREIFYSRLLPLISLYKGPDHPGPLKQLLGLAGFPVGAGRSPLQPLSDERLVELAQRLQELRLVEHAGAGRA